MSRCTIVVVDDDPGVLKALTLLLEAFQWKVVAFSTPADAISFLNANPPPDVILSDLRMPGMTGLDLLASIRQLPLEVPFVLMSGHATPQEASEAETLGTAAFLPKPFTPVQLQQVLGGLAL